MHAAHKKKVTKKSFSKRETSLAAEWKREGQPLRQSRADKLIFKNRSSQHRPKEPRHGEH